jgi:hypothetical protein
MIPAAREVRLPLKIRKVLEARCRAPTTPQRDVKRARIVLLAAEGRSTRSIAEEVGVQPRIVSNWRRRFANHGLGGALVRSLESTSRGHDPPDSVLLTPNGTSPPSIHALRKFHPIISYAMVGQLIIRHRHGVRCTVPPLKMPEHKIARATQQQQSLASCAALGEYITSNATAPPCWLQNSGERP